MTYHFTKGDKESIQIFFGDNTWKIAILKTKKEMGR